MAHAIKAVAVMLLPFIPNMASRILEDLKVPKKNIVWGEIEALFKEGHRVTRTVKPIFTKIDKDELMGKLEKMRAGVEAELIDIEDFNKLDLRIGKIVEVSPVEGRDRLLKLAIDVGGEPKTVVAGLAKEYKREELLGKEVVVICNLKAKVIAGIRSEAMLLAAVSDDGKVSLLTPDREMPPGCKVC